LISKVEWPKFISLIYSHGHLSFPMLWFCWNNVCYNIFDTLLFLLLSTFYNLIRYIDISANRVLSFCVNLFRNLSVFIRLGISLDQIFFRDRLMSLCLCLRHSSFLNHFYIVKPLKVDNETLITIASWSLRLALLPTFH
jgi:hypothetical protein